jgi:hypothetical protein
MENNNDEKLSEEDIQHLKKMEQQQNHPHERDVGEMLDEYYEKHPEKAPLKVKLKKRLAEAKVARQEEKQIYKEAYRKQKLESIEARAKRQAKRKYAYTPMERFSGTMKPTPYYPKKRKLPKRPRQPKRYEPQINFESPLGSFTGPSQKPVKIDFDEALGGFKKQKKRKDFNPFEKLF